VAAAESERAQSINNVEASSAEAINGELVDSLCHDGRLEQALEAYGKLSLEERQGVAVALGKCGGELDLSRIRDLAALTKDDQERGALYEGLFSKWCIYASDEASAAVAALPEGDERRLQARGLGKNLLAGQPVVGATWLFYADVEAEDDENLLDAAKTLGRQNYQDAMKLVAVTPFSPERRSVLEEAARKSWNQQCAACGDWDKIISLPSQP
jgi:hypothetical protein